MSPPANREVLPSDAVPTNYNVTLDPDFTKFTFDGTVVIDLDVRKATDFVALNVLELDIHSVKVHYNAKTASAISFHEDKETQRLEIRLPEALQAASAVALEIAFTGELNDKLAGFYRSVRKDESGKTEIVAVSQMEATDCRRAFPCFDEPSHKATFDVTLVHAPEQTALSNMDVKGTKTLESGRVATSFHKSPKMSSYLIAFAIGEFDVYESTAFRVPVRTYGPKGTAHKLKYSTELAANCLKFFEDTFDIPYPLPKMDMLGLHDFAAGAMENWGLITYRIVDVLVDDGKESIGTLKRVSEVVCHELAHQWFGNLVTMEWWDGLWLNEGFATWMSFLATSHFYPEWEVWEDFVLANVFPAMTLDALRSSHPIQVPIQKAAEVNEIFDAISYAKGGTVLHMISSYLGKETFIKGVSHYLKKHKYSNTYTSDLWESLSEVSGKDVLSVMNEWTSKIGYPYVKITENADKRSVSVEQHRYLTTGDAQPSEDETIYPVSLAIKTDGAFQDVFLKERKGEFSTGPDDFFFFNSGKQSMYRALYEPERIIKLSKAGTEGRLSTLDRMGLLNDVGSLAQAGYEPTVDLLNLIDSWKSEESTNVWAEILTNLAMVKRAWKHEPTHVLEAIDKFRVALVKPLLKKVGYRIGKDDPAPIQELKASLFATAVSGKDEEFVKVALDMYKKHISGHQKVDPNFRGTVFMCAARNGDETTYNELYNLYNKGDSPAEGNSALSYLSIIPDKELRLKTLDSVLNGRVRKQDAPYALTNFTDSPESVALFWDWFQKNWENIRKEFPPSLTLLPSFVKIAANGMTTEEQLKEFSAFFEGRDLTGIAKAVEQSKDGITSRLKWVTRDRAAVSDWLASKSYAKI